MFVQVEFEMFSTRWFKYLETLNLVNVENVYCRIVKNEPK